MPKVGRDQTRLIFHLSFDFGEKEKEHSVNFHTPKEFCSVKYHDLDFAVKAYLSLIESEDEETDSGDHQDGPHLQHKTETQSRRQFLRNKWRSEFDGHKRKSKKIMYAGKTDLKSAFRILGLSPDCWKWLVMKAKDPITQEWWFFVNKCLLFGSSISCTLFQKFSDALCYLITTKAGPGKKIMNYLDDFLFLALSLLSCNATIQQFLDLCKDLNIPIADDKTEWSAETVVFLGILLDGAKFVLAVPIEKRDKAITLLREFLIKKKTTVKKLQQLCGYLSFICRAVYPGCPFIQRMYSKYSHLVNINKGARRNDSDLKFMYKYKQHYHVRLDGEFKADYRIWIEFLQGELATVVNQPMVDILGQLRMLKDIQFSSDASASAKQGFGYGCVLNDCWI